MSKFPTTLMKFITYLFSFPIVKITFLLDLDLNDLLILLTN